MNAIDDAREHIRLDNTIGDSDHRCQITAYAGNARRVQFAVEDRWFTRSQDFSAKLDDTGPPEFCINSSGDIGWSGIFGDFVVHIAREMGRYSHTSLSKLPNRNPAVRGNPRTSLVSPRCSVLVKSANPIFRRCRKAMWTKELWATFRAGT